MIVFNKGICFVVFLSILILGCAKQAPEIQRDEYFKWVQDVSLEHASKMSAADEFVSIIKNHATVLILSGFHCKIHATNIKFKSDTPYLVSECSKEGAADLDVYKNREYAEGRIWIWKRYEKGSHVYEVWVPVFGAVVSAYQDPIYSLTTTTDTSGQHGFYVTHRIEFNQKDTALRAAALLIYISDAY